MLGLDSSAIIDFADGDLSLKKLLESNKEPLVVNQISYLEIMFGIDLSNEDYKGEEDFYDHFFKNALDLNLDIAASKKASEVYWDLKKKGVTIDNFDCAIVGIYLANGINKIITRNVKHFENIKGLKVISY